MRRRTKDFTGQRFSKLVAIRDTGKRTPSCNAIWELRCDCGGVRFANSGELTRGGAKSCGCSLRTQFDCTAPGCLNPAHSKHLCHKHLHRIKATGLLDRSATGTSFDIVERFKLKTKRTEGGCLEWTGTLGEFGYGQTTVKQKRYNCHRLAWEMASGKIPDGMSILHKCDNPKCVEIEHLFLGTQKDNVHDAIAKGRFDPYRIARLRKAAVSWAR